MSSSGSWSSDLFNEEQVPLEPSSESDDNLGAWLLVPLSVIAILLIGVSSYDPCKEDENNENDVLHTRP